MKNRFQFRLGTTFCIVLDGLVQNVTFPADKADEVELVLFESDEISNLPSPATVQKLREIAETLDLTYSVHLPLDAWMGHEDTSVRQRSVE